MAEINEQYMEHKGIVEGMPVEILYFKDNSDNSEVGYYFGFDESCHGQEFVLLNRGQYRHIMPNAIKDVKKLTRTE